MVGGVGMGCPSIPKSGVLYATIIFSCICSYYFHCCIISNVSLFFSMVLGRNRLATAASRADTARTSNTKW